jgi:hypothetical protein
LSLIRLRYTGRRVPTLPDSLPPDVVQALKLGRPVEAIKRLRKSGIGLAEAKALIEAFSSGKTAYQPPGANPMPRQAKVRKPPAEERRLSESHARHEMVQPPAQLISRAGLGQGEVPNSNAAFWWVVMLVIVALVGYYVLER